MSSGASSGGDHEDMISTDSPSTLEGPVLVSGKHKTLKLSFKGLVLSAPDNEAKSVASKSKDLSLTWPDVVCASKDLSSKSGQHTPSFTLHYINQVKNKCRVHKIQITVTDGQVDHWVSAITEKCSRVPGRPRKVFVVVNTIGGARQGRQIYQKTVAPLFELAKITTDVLYTERSKQALEVGEKQNFSGYDAVIIVGGDGTYQEVLLGLTLQLQKGTGVDIDNPDTKLVTPDIVFGVIPAGTGNGFTGWCNDIIDVVSATLNIIRGENHRAQVMRFYSSGKFVTLCGVVFGYGEFSDLVKRSDELRWMGRIRYPYTMLGMLVKKPRMFKCQIEYKLADHQNSPDNCTGSGAGDMQASEWKTLADNGGPICGLLTITCEGITNNKHIIFKPYGSYINLLVDYGCGRVDLMKTLFQYISGKNSANPLPPKLLRISEVIAFRVKIIPEESETGRSVSSARARNEELTHYLDIDGEVVRVDLPDIDIRVQPGFVSVFGQQKWPTESSVDSTASQ